MGFQIPNWNKIIFFFRVSHLLRSDPHPIITAFKKYLYIPVVRFVRSHSSLAKLFLTNKKIVWKGEAISKYHLEAGIAYEHAKATHYTATNWPNILQLYNLLCKFFASPVVELNRAIVISVCKRTTFFRIRYNNL